MSGSVAPGTWSVPPELAGERLDRALAGRLGVARNQVQGWIRDGRVTLDGRTALRAAESLHAGALLAWDPPPADDGRVTSALLDETGGAGGDSVVVARGVASPAGWGGALAIAGWSVSAAGEERGWIRRVNGAGDVG